MMTLRVFRRSGLPVRLESSEVEALKNLPINEAIEYERVLRKSGRETETITKVKGLMQLSEILDQVSRYSSIQTRMVGSEDMIVEILDNGVTV